VCRELLKAGAVVDLANQRRYGQTPLQVAALKGHDKVISVLLEYSASLEMENNNSTGPRVRDI